jgi:hypothetical protein
MKHITTKVGCNIRLNAIGNCLTEWTDAMNAEAYCLKRKKKKKKLKVEEGSWGEWGD